MKAALVLLCCLTCASAIGAATKYAHWTGVKKFSKSPTNQDAIDCEYDYSGSKFWREFLLSKRSDCPSTVEVDE